MHRFEDPGGRQTRRSGRKELKRSIRMHLQSEKYVFHENNAFSTW